MTVYIAFGQSSAGEDVVTLVLRDDESGESHGSFRGYASGARVPDPSDEETWWEWENPNAELEDVTLSPSLRLPGEFHIYIRGGEIEHCNDCPCGCSKENLTKTD